MTGIDLRGDILDGGKPSPDIQRKAALVICANSETVSEAKLLIAMFGDTLGDIYE